ncbi:hypothetical protein G195_007590 [Phytophthora kernoviae 00238/432]|uniref:Helicase ATP-binding domain-containing protein n=1 Tax=Phytophthora kernoviae 00238/432 TaxID=1284355 RepID=A0A8J4W4E4_9STRA|nr:hypothetical protein G195_007590 [Phytophthora kernoviae 00238/432]
MKEDGDTEAGPTFYSPWDITETRSGLLVPSYVLTQLLPHQRECLEWLHGLHERGVGGILVLLQWVRELHKWVPLVRVVLLHASGTGVNTSSSLDSYEQLIEEVFSFENEDFGDGSDATGYRGMREDAPTGGGVVISTYESVRQYQNLFLAREWDYVVLDEGHRVRNPDAETTLACKQLRTVHRIILSGTPIQNRLRELWSLFDFVYPGRLGTLPTFDDEFVLPIRAGGYATASKMQVLMAYKCALALKDLIQPFLLRRTKQEVLTNGDSSMGALLPGKQEQILFCRLTKRQRALYKRFLASPEIASVLRRDIRPFRAISVLRHICNHPDLLASFGDGRLADKRRQAHDDDDDEVGQGDSFGDMSDLLEEANEDKEDNYFGAASASGKMIVLQKVLTMWKLQGHRVLIFTQTRSMLDILESFMSRLKYACCRLDGTTGVAERQSRLDAFNAPDSKLFAFLLTTRAGGIGVNLVGADRVVVFDPDWNPSTDVQARERAWRIGQTKPVTVYRLVTAGTIEEKIYHRQIFKQYLTSKVLHDAKRKRCFNKHSLRDLFVLADEKEEEEGVTETTELFVAGNVDRPDGQPKGLEDGEEEETDNGETPPLQEDNGDNDAVLKQLFDGGNVRGVFDHSAVESDGVQNQEADLVEMEATKIAQGALSALRASGALVQQQRESIFTPTWTGRSATKILMRSSLSLLRWTGCCVFWGLTREEEARHMMMLTPFSSGSMGQVDAAQDMKFSYSDETSIAKDAITLCSTTVEEKIALSFAMSQSATLGAFETRVEDRIRSTKHIPSSLAIVGSIQYSQSDTSKLIGQLFIELADVNLHSNVLDEPEYFLKSTDNGDFKQLYEKMLKYQDVANRIAILNKRLGILRDLVGVLNQHLTHHHGTKLEWIVIWMLVAQVIIAIGWDIMLKDVLGYFRW